MEKEVNVIITILAKLLIDEDSWPEDWDLKKEVGHQIGFDNAREYEILYVDERDCGQGAFDG